MEDMAQQGSHGVTLSLRKYFLGGSLPTPINNVYPRCLPEVSTCQVELTLSGCKLLLFYVEESGAVLVHLLSEPDEEAPWFGVFGVELNEVKELLMNSEKDLRPGADVTDVQRWFFHCFLSAEVQRRHLYLVTTNALEAQPEHPVDALHLALKRVYLGSQLNQVGVHPG
jgi:hypothetical protein